MLAQAPRDAAARTRIGTVRIAPRAAGASEAGPEKL
jgi:hypothetical protein